MNERRHELRRYPWRVRDSGQLLLVVAAGVWMVAAVAQTAADGLTDPRIAIAFGALIAFGEVLRLNLPGDRESAPIGFAGALAYALLIRVGSHVVQYGAEQVVTVAALLLEAVLTALLRVDEQRARFRVALVDEMRVQLPLGAAVGASALLIAFAAEVMGLAALAVFTAPLLVTQVAFRRYAGIRATYLQTVRALAKVTEIGGYVEAGHSERVSRLAVAIGRELGIHEPQLLELEYAALMRDIGQLSLHDPIPGGATVLVSRQDQQRIAELGADVIQQAQVLGSVAEIVRRQNEPYRDTGHAANGRAGLAEPYQGSRPPLSSRIIKAANAFDDLVGSSLDPGRAAAAVQRLRLDTASEYDPATVEALSRVVNRRSVML